MKTGMVVKIFKPFLHIRIKEKQTKIVKKNRCGQCWKTGLKEMKIQRKAQSLKSKIRKKTRMGKNRRGML